MGKNTKISWCDHTFNPWWGCSPVSAGCENCYAEAWARRTGFNVFGSYKPRRFFGERYWDKPLQWDRDAAAAGVRRRVFCGSMCDVFEHDPNYDRPAVNGQRQLLWSLVERTPHLDWLLLTKRPQNMLKLAPAAWESGWPSNVWALTTIENQDVAAERAEALLKVPAKVRGLSIEPLLGSLDLGLLNWANIPRDDCRIDWVIVGCESGPHRRPCRMKDVRLIVEDCRIARVPCFVKQLSIDGRVSTDPADWPEDLRIQEFPKGLSND